MPATREGWVRRAREAEVTANRQLISGIANFRDKPIGAVDEGTTLGHRRNAALDGLTQPPVRPGIGLVELCCPGKLAARAQG